MTSEQRRVLQERRSGRRLLVAVRSMPQAGCQLPPCGSWAMDSAGLRASQTLPVFLGDGGGQVPRDGGQLAKCTRYGGEADAL